MSETMIHIMTPTSGKPDAHYTLSLLRAAIDLGVAGIKYAVGMVVGVTPVDVARNEAVAMFLDGDATHLMFVDDDQTFTARDIMLLREANKPIIGAMVPKRIFAEGAHYNVTPMSKPSVDGYHVSVEHVGTGFMMIQREVLLKMIDGPPIRMNQHDRWPIFQCGIDADAKQFLSEDYAFCARARKLGFQSWAHTGLRIGHVGKMVFNSTHSPEEKIALLSGAAT